MNFKRYHVSKNLFDKNSAVVGNILSDDTIGTNTSVMTSDYIAVSPNTTYTATYLIVAYWGRAVAYYKNDKTFISHLSNDVQSDDGTATFTFTTPNNCYYMRIATSIRTTNHVNEIMCNEGSTPQPYEPYGDTWLDSYYIMGTDTDTITLPQTIYGDGTNATVNLKGNTETSGAPSPQNPVDVNGVGERTTNIADITTFQDNMTLDLSSGLPVETGNSRIATIVPIDVSNNTVVKVVFSYSGQSTSVRFMYSIFNNGTLIERVASKQSGDVVDVSNADELYICIYTVSKEEISNLMVSEGAGSVPYEPFGYKIPLSISLTTTNIYIGDNPLRKSLDGTAYDTLVADGTLTQRVDSGGSVLATPVVTQITMPTFTLADGANTVSVDTTVQPSEMTMTYHGWHPVAAAHERSGGQWD